VIMRKICRTVTELDNSLSSEQEGEHEWLHSKFRAACK
jgi:hypothetical protein